MPAPTPTRCQLPCRVAMRRPPCPRARHRSSGLCRRNLWHRRRRHRPPTPFKTKPLNVGGSEEQPEEGNIALTCLMFYCTKPNLENESTEIHAAAASPAIPPPPHTASEGLRPSEAQVIAGRPLHSVSTYRTLGEGERGCEASRRREPPASELDARFQPNQLAEAPAAVRSTAGSTETTNAGVTADEVFRFIFCKSS
jgi:hypothetical protein